MSTCPICGVALPPAKRTGRPRAYCSATCRQAAWRERTQLTAWVEVVDPVDEAALREVTAQAVEAELEARLSAPAVDQLARAVTESRVLARQYQRLARSLPDGLAWRSDGMAQTLAEGLGRFFSEAEGAS